MGKDTPKDKPTESVEMLKKLVKLKTDLAALKRLRPTSIEKQGQGSGDRLVTEKKGVGKS